MRKVTVGIQINLEGISFFGIEEVNGLINRGGKVTSIEPGGAFVRKLGQEGENVSLTLNGCQMEVMVDDTEVESSPANLEHNRLFREGRDLVSPYMHIVDRDHRSAASDDARAELKRGIDRLRQAVAINPANWSACWIIGKAYQALGNPEAACEAFGKAYALQAENADVAREYMFECLILGKAKQGIAAAQRGVRIKPDDAGLTANLALACLIGGQLDEAGTAVERAIEMAPDDRITHNLKQMIDDVRTGRRAQPESLADLERTDA